MDMLATPRRQKELCSSKNTPPPPWGAESLSLPLFTAQSRLRLSGAASVYIRGWPLPGLYLEHGDNGPQEGVKVLPVGDRVTGVCLQAELAAKEVHTQDAEGGRQQGCGKWAGEEVQREGGRGATLPGNPHTQ